MAIQTINDALPNGDTPRKINEKINENFSNKDHAASKLVGTENGQIPLAQDTYKAAFSQPMRISSETDVNEMPAGEMLMYGTSSLNTPIEGQAWIVRSILDYTGSFIGQFQIAHKYDGGDVYTRQKQKWGWTEWAKHYTSASTKKDSNTNLLLDTEDSIPNTSAASKTIGTGRGQVSLNEDLFKASQEAISVPTAIPGSDANTLEAGDRVYFTSSSVNGPTSSVIIDTYARFKTNRKYQIAYRGVGINSNFYYRFGDEKGTWSEWSTIYSTGNTKLDTNGAVSPSSPTIDLYSDRIETNADGSKMNPEFVRNGVGDYTIKNTTGLRDEGWYIKIPNDMNGNPKVAVAIDTDKDGNLSIKTYKRTFSLETFTFGPDLAEPLDIPEGRWIDLRFNDLPQEELYEPEPEEEPIVDEVDEPVVEEETEAVAEDEPEPEVVEEPVVEEPEVTEEEPKD